MICFKSINLENGLGNLTGLTCASFEEMLSERTRLPYS